MSMQHKQGPLWSTVYVTGVIGILPAGRTQPEKRYILETVLEHLPKLDGVDIHIIQKDGMTSFCTQDEFGQRSNLGNSPSPGHMDDFAMQDRYMVVIDGGFPCRDFHDGVRIFSAWLCRLAKRVGVDDVLIKTWGYERGKRKTCLFDNPYPYIDMWDGTDESADWCGYLMWKPADNPHIRKKDSGK